MARAIWSGSVGFGLVQIPVAVHGAEDKDELVTAELDLALVEEVRRIWQFYRDRRPETYEKLTADLP